MPINVNVGVSSTTAMQDDINLSASVNGVQANNDVSLERVVFKNTRIKIFDSSEYGNSYIFIKFLTSNTTQTASLTDSAGTTTYMKFFSGQVALFPWEGSLDLYISASANVNEVAEIGIFER